MTEHKYGSIELRGTTIPLTKFGFPNCKYLNKTERTVVKEFVNALNKKKKEELLNQLQETLDNLEIDMRYI